MCIVLSRKKHENAKDTWGVARCPRCHHLYSGKWYDRIHSGTLQCLIYFVGGKLVEGVI